VPGDVSRPGLGRGEDVGGGKGGTLTEKGKARNSTRCFKVKKTTTEEEGGNIYIRNFTQRKRGGGLTI